MNITVNVEPNKLFPNGLAYLQHNFRDPHPPSSSTVKRAVMSLNDSVRKKFGFDPIVLDENIIQNHITKFYGNDSNFILCHRFGFFAQPMIWELQQKKPSNHQVRRWVNECRDRIKKHLSVEAKDGFNLDRFAAINRKMQINELYQAIEFTPVTTKKSRSLAEFFNLINRIRKNCGLATIQDFNHQEAYVEMLGGKKAVIDIFREGQFESVFAIERSACEWFPKIPLKFENPLLDQIKAAQSLTKGEQTRFKPGYVYVASNPAWPGWYKIGSTLDLTKRLGSFQTSTPFGDFKLESHIIVDDRRDVERQAHEFFAEFRGKGEWFNIEQEKIENFLQKIEKSYCIAEQVNV